MPACAAVSPVTSVRTGGSIRVRVYLLRRHDGSEIVVMIADSEQALLETQKAIMTTGLLPAEDPALLPAPDRIELYPVIAAHHVNPASKTRSGL